GSAPAIFVGSCVNMSWRGSAPEYHIGVMILWVHVVFSTNISGRCPFGIRWGIDLQLLSGRCPFGIRWGIDLQILLGCCPFLESLKHISMANTYTQCYFHLVFAVKHRDALIKKEWKNDLEMY